MQEYRFPMCTIGGRTAYIVLRIDADAAVSQVQDIRDRMKNRSGLWGPIGAAARADFRDKFQRGGDPPWAPLSQRTTAQKRRLIQQGVIPRKTATGRIPRRLLQQGEFGPGTILIMSGGLRDSWVQKNAKGHIEQERGDEFFVGSQYTKQAELAPSQAERDYQILTKKARVQRARGATVRVLIPIARFHEEGTKHMPARPVAVGPDGEALLSKDTLSTIEQAAVSWMTGERQL